MENRLEQILKEQGRKHGWLADRARVHRNTIRSLINGAEPRLKAAYRIARVLGLTVYDIWPDIKE